MSIARYSDVCICEHPPGFIARVISLTTLTKYPPYGGYFVYGVKKDIITHMLRKSFFIEMLLLLILIAVIHITGSYLFWYWHYFWLDILMHFLGGLWVGLASFWILEASGRGSDAFKSQMQAVLFGLACAFAIGVLWEIFENVTGIAFVAYEEYIPDTLMDLVMDSLGGILAGLYAWRILRRK